MLPWSPPRWGAGPEEAPEGLGLVAGKDQGEPWSSGADAPRDLGTSPWDSPRPPSRSPSWTRSEQLPLPHRLPGPATEQPPGAPAPRSPQVAWEVDPSRMTPLAPWDPKYEAKAGRQPVWGANCSSGASFSGRTLCHPSFWPLYEAASGRGLRPVAPATGHWNGQQAHPDAGTSLGPLGVQGCPNSSQNQCPGVGAHSLPPQWCFLLGFPVMCCEDVFLSDPLLPQGQRVPLYLSKAPQQVMGSLKLLPPPPIMSAWVLPRLSPSRSPSTAWLSGPELIALTGLLQMSQGEPRPSSSLADTPPAGPPDPTSDPPSPCGSPSSSQGADPSLPQTPDTHCP
uniref:histone deacetylase complex subunit SAP25 isoform X1 n=1 Tax=Macaca mulatta TaxID=9544 RepID=UPI0010A278BB|nr:histone deacetylase complex subunit SAP25 isoform X1 [Macaca mulatta]